MTLVIAFNENGKNYLVADRMITKLNLNVNKFEISRLPECKIKHGHNFDVALTTPNIAILDFFEHAVSNIQIEDSKKGVYDILVGLNKRINTEFTFIRDSKNQNYE